MAVALLLVFHAPLLRLLATPLVVDDVPQSVDAVVVMGGGFGEAPFDEIAQLYHQGYVREIVLIEDVSSRLTQLGVLPPSEAVMRKELTSRGVSLTALTVLSGNYPSFWAAAPRLHEWLESHSAAHVIVLSDEFGSRANRYVVRRVLGSEAASRVRWRIIHDPRYNLSNWWRSRQGLVAVGGAYVALAHTELLGEPPEAERWDPDQYESTLPRAEGAR